MNKSKRLIFMVLGWFFVALASVGVLLPVLPTTPFLLLAAYFFARSSERFHRWLLENRWFGAYIRNYRDGRGMLLRDKLVTLNLEWMTIGVTIIYVGLPYLVDLLLFVIAIGVSTHILKIPTTQPSAILVTTASPLPLDSENDPAA